MVKIQWLGHAGFRISNKTTIIIDPFLTGNPKARVSLEEIDRADIVCVTHGHGDHLGDSIEIAKRHNSTLVGIYEVAVFANKKGIEKVEPMNIGGTIRIDDIEITMTEAKHSSDIVDANLPGGHSCGFVITIDDLRIYHAGDTSLFSDMQLIGEVYKPDVALLPIGDRFTMGPREAAMASELIRPKVVIPMHYNTFPLITQDPEHFSRCVKSLVPEVEVVLLAPGETYSVKKKD
ncbi:MAG: metal-dependent hydrolase [Candidatus Hydrothermarchaeota archaeon]